MTRVPLNPTSLYFRTTDPRLAWTDFFSWPMQVSIAWSIAVHTSVYVAMVNMACWVATGKGFAHNDRLVLALVIVMYFGYIGRLWHAKAVLAATACPSRTRQFMNQHYNTWLFIG